MFPLYLQNTLRTARDTVLITISSRFTAISGTLHCPSIQPPLMMVAPHVADTTSTTHPLEPTKAIPLTLQNQWALAAWGSGKDVCCAHPAGREDDAQNAASRRGQALFPLLLVRPLVHVPAPHAIKFHPNCITTMLKVILFVLYSSPTLPRIDSLNFVSSANFIANSFLLCQSH